MLILIYGNPVFTYADWNDPGHIVLLVLGLLVMPGITDWITDWNERVRISNTIV